MGVGVMVMAGGTGGHVFPALAVAEHFRASGVDVLWLGTRRGLEARVVPAAGFDIEWISITGLRGKGLAGWAVSPLRLCIACFQAWRILLRHRPQVVLGMGGFVTGPAGVVARVMGIPLVIHEQNALPGLTNRLLSRIANRVLEAFAGTFPAVRRAVCTGNPVRPAIEALPGPRQRLRREGARMRLLVVGGSQGARVLNDVVPRALEAMVESLRPEVMHQCGRGNVEETRQAYAAAGVKAEVLPFIDDMAGAYGWADLVLCRAGALSVSELASAGLGAILVPYPHAVDDHQTFNAQYLCRAGAAILLEQARLSGEALSPLLTDLAEDADRRVRMAEAARALAQENATEKVAGVCMEFIG